MGDADRETWMWEVGAPGLSDRGGRDRDGLDAYAERARQRLQRRRKLAAAHSQEEQGAHSKGYVHHHGDAERSEVHDLRDAA